MNVLKDVFGRTYLMVSSQGGLENNKLKPMIFHEAISAKRFLNGMNVSHGFWRRFSISLDFSNPNVRSENEFIDLVSTMIVRGRVKVYESFIPSQEKAPRSSRSIDAGFGKQLVFLSAGESALGKSKVIKRFTSEKEAADFLQSLNLTEGNLTAISETIYQKNAITTTSQGKRKIIAEALLAEEIVIHERIKKGPVPKESEALDSTHDIPGNRPVDAPPPAEEKPKQKKEENQSRDAEQAEALVKAAEVGEAFCEDCQKVDDENNASASPAGKTSNTEHQQPVGDSNSPDSESNSAAKGKKESVETSDDNPKEELYSCDWKDCDGKHPSKVEYKNDGVTSRGSYTGVWKEPWSNGVGTSSKEITIEHYESETGKETSLDEAKALFGSSKYVINNHHLIPVATMEKVPKLSHNAKLIGFNINDGEYGICLPYFITDIFKHDLQSHKTNHPNYSKKVLEHLKVLDKRSKKYCQNGTQKNLISDLSRFTDKLRDYIRSWDGAWLLRKSAVQDREQSYRQAGIDLPKN